jgi:hypothetical protein
VIRYQRRRRTVEGKDIRNQGEYFVAFGRLASVSAGSHFRKVALDSEEDS